MQASTGDLVWVRGFQNLTIPNMHFSFNSVAMANSASGVLHPS